MSTAEPQAAWVPQWSFADRLRKIRRDARLSQGEFAGRLGVRPSTFSAWETGRNVPDELIATAKRIEMMTGVPAVWTLGLSEATPTDPRDGSAVGFGPGVTPFVPGADTRWSSPYEQPAIAA